MAEQAALALVQAQAAMPMARAQIPLDLRPMAQQQAPPVEQVELSH